MRAWSEELDVKCVAFVPKATIRRETDSLLCMVVGRFTFVGYHDGYRYPVDMENMNYFHIELFLA
jgi:hypothetical protein